MSFQASSDGGRDGNGDGSPPARYAFDEFVVDAEARTLVRAGEPVALTPKAFDTLLALLRRSGRLVSKDELLATIWPDTFIEEATLAQNVFTVRRALGSRADGGAFIETVPKHGYRFAVEVRPLPAAPPPRVASPAVPPPLPLSLPTAPPVSSPLPPPPAAPALALPPRVAEARRWPVATLALLLLVSAAVVVAIGARRRPAPPAPPAFRPQRVERLTVDGTARHAAVSASGTYVALVRAEADGRQGLWLRQSAASATVAVVPPAAVDYGGLVFAPGDRSILYVLYPHGESIASLYEVPTLGGI